MFSVLKSREIGKDKARQQIFKTYLNTVKNGALFLGEFMGFNESIYLYSNSLFVILDFFRIIQLNMVKSALTRVDTKMRFSFKLHIIFEESFKYQLHDLTDMFYVGFDTLSEFLNKKRLANMKMPTLYNNFSYLRNKTGLPIDYAHDFKSNINSQFITIYFDTKDTIVFEKNPPEKVHGIFHYGQWKNKNPTILKKKEEQQIICGLILEKNKSMRIH